VDTSTSDDGDDRTSQGGTQDSNRYENRNNGSDSSADDELSGGDSSRSNDADSDDAEWSQLQADLQTERKRRQDAQRKITEQGNERKTLEQTVKDLENQVSTYKSQVAELIAGGGNSDRSSALFGGSDTDDETGDDGLRQEVKMLREVVSKYVGNVNDVTSRFDNLEEERTYESDVAALQEQFGVNRDAAQTMIEAFDLGNVVAFAKAFEMASLPREARESLREERQRRRTAAAVGHPGVPNTSFSPTDTSDNAGREEEATRILSIRGGKARRQAIEDAIEKDPGIFEFLRAGLAEATGFNL
jgi:hypothetical protein